MATNRLYVFESGGEPIGCMPYKAGQLKLYYQKDPPNYSDEDQPGSFSYLRVTRTSARSDRERTIATFRVVECDYTEALCCDDVGELDPIPFDAPFAGESAQAMFDGLDDNRNRFEPGYVIVVDDNSDNFTSFFEKSSELTSAITQLILTAFHSMKTTEYKDADEFFGYEDALVLGPVYFVFHIYDVWRVLDRNPRYDKEEESWRRQQELLASRLTACGYEPVAYDGSYEDGQGLMHMAFVASYDGRC